MLKVTTSIAMRGIRLRGVLICFFFMTIVGVRGGAQKVVLFLLDGVGHGLAERGGLPSSSGRWARGAVSTPEGDTCDISSMLATGCDSLAPGAVSTTRQGVPADKISQSFSRAGYLFGLVTTKCGDDGTSSGFVASWKDRYDLDGVATQIAELKPAPALISGGFSRSLWKAAASQGAKFVEFESLGGSAFSETCEYPNSTSFERRATRAMDFLDSSGGRYLLVFIFTGIDSAAHAGDEARVTKELASARASISSIETHLESGGGAWKMVVVGSHDTGGVSTNGSLSHAHHSKPGTSVPLFSRGVREYEVTKAKTMGDVSRLLSTKMTCSRDRSHVYLGSKRKNGDLSYGEEYFVLWLTAVCVVFAAAAVCGLLLRCNFCEDYCRGR
jgi:hypothetical protein